MASSIEEAAATRAGVEPPSPLVVFAGAGASAAAGLPTWNELLSSVLSNVADVGQLDVGSSQYRAVLDALLENGVVSTADIAPGEELAALTELRRLKEAASYALNYFVAHARAAGRTWSEIGEALGTTAQNAQRNYRRLVTTNFDQLLEQSLDQASQQGHDWNDEVPPGVLSDEVIDLLVRPLTERSASAPSTVMILGTRGSGKTSTARLIASALHRDVVYIGPSQLRSRGTDRLPQELAELFVGLEHLKDSVVVLDDLDEFFANRETSGLNQRLATVALLTGIERVRKGSGPLVILTAALPSAEIDPALLRRMDVVLRLGFEEAARTADEPGLKVRAATASRTATQQSTGAETSTPLTGREVEVLRQLATGKTYREIAEDLYLSVNTVRSHAMRIYRKLGVDNRVAALAESRARQIL